MSAADATVGGKKKGSWLDTIERVGNKVPHPVMIFVYLIIGVIVLSAILSALGVGVTEEVFVPAPKTVTAEDVGAPAAQNFGSVRADRGFDSQFLHRLRARRSHDSDS